MNIYIASSCNNTVTVPQLVKQLQGALGSSTTVYNFLSPTPTEPGFSWDEVDSEHAIWTHWAWLQALVSLPAVRGYQRNLSAMHAADLCILLLPCGRSAHLEAGWCAGKSKKLFIYGPPQIPNPTSIWEHDLMYKLADGLFTTFKLLSKAIKELPVYSRTQFNVDGFRPEGDDPNRGAGGS